jgi:hypothetical protein
MFNKDRLKALADQARSAVQNAQHQISSRRGSQQGQAPGVGGSLRRSRPLLQAGGGPAGLGREGQTSPIE